MLSFVVEIFQQEMYIFSGRYYFQLQNSKRGTPSRVLSKWLRC